MAEAGSVIPGAPGRGGAPGGIDRALGRSWVLRWDTAREPRPAVLHVPGPVGDASLFRALSGDFVAFDGYLFDPGAPGLSGAARVASGHARWGERLFENMSGGFTAAVWDEGRRRLVVGRDALGLAPCFYSWSGRVLLIATSLDAILAQRGIAGTFNRAYLAEYLQDLSLSHQVEETLYAEIRRLPPAHVLRLADRALDLSRYWDPVPPGFAWARPDEVERFEALLERAVSRCLAAGADSIALSGGFDSVGVATLASEQLREASPLWAVSLRFDGTVCDEGASQVEVARALGMPQIIRTIEESLAGETVVGAALALSRSSPSPVLSPWQSIYTGLLRAASGIGLRRLLMGTGGDDLLNVDPTYGADRLAALDFRGLWRFCRACQRTSPFSPARVARGVFWNHAALPELMRLGRAILGRASPPALEWARRRRQRRARPAWAAPSDRDLSGWLEERRRTAARIPLGPGERSYVHTLRGLTQAPLVLLERDQSHAWARQLGFTFLLPYFDRDLADLSLRIPAEELIAGGRHKTPLRRLVAKRLPAVAMRSTKVDFSQAVHGVLRPEGRAAWREFGGPTMLADLGLVDARRLGCFMDDYFEARNSSWLHAWLALSTEMWLRARSATSFPSGEQEAVA